ncbi:MAG: tetratricopeptide repeat protein [Geminicoccaceae bacterium]
MLRDRQGHPMTGATMASADAYDRAIDAFNVYRGDPLALLDEALAEAPAHVMALLARAELLALATEPAASVAAAAVADALATLSLNDREASHLAALRHLLDGEWTRAAVALDLHGMRWPRDLLALQVGHLLDFYRGSARDLRDRVARGLPAWDGDVPGRGIVVGMHAFGLEECGDYARAEDAGRAAIDADPRDCWAHHAVAHVMEMQGRAQDGIGWMLARQPWWADDSNFFKVHNWWHRALCHLDLGQTGFVLDLYDSAIRGTPSTVALDLVDASALLWRLTLTGVDVGGRWGEVADAWQQHADGKLYPFNDWHAAMACLGAGREPELARLRAEMRRTAEGSNEVAAWTGAVGLPLVDGFAAFHRGDHAAAVELLHPVRYVAARAGGSHAQRDIIDWTLAEAALRGGMADLARALTAERAALKPHSPVIRDMVGRAATLQPAPV